MGRITSFSKQVIVFFLVTALMIRPTFAANIGGWTLGGGVAQGASTVYEGTKKFVIDGVDYIKRGTAKITPTASGVAKVLARGAAGYALSVAVEQLLGSVDWVLDPANNQIKYTEVSTDVTGSYIHVQGIVGTSAINACQNWLNKVYLKNNPTHKPKVNKVYNFTLIDQGVHSFTCEYLVDFDKNDNIDQFYPYTTSGQVRDLVEQKGEVKTLPLPTVAAQVISNAESNTDKRAAAQAATTAAAADIVAEAEKDEAKARPIAQQLESSAQTKPADEAAAEKANEAQGQSKPNTQNPEAMDLSLEFPVFCGWAPLVCEAAQVVISFPITLTDWWNTGKLKAEEWATSISEAWSKVKEEYNEKPKENTDTELDIPDQSPPDINTDISFGGSCPASRSVPVSFAGISTEIEFSFQWFCEVASIAKPVVISISAFAAALIVAGVRTEDD